MNKKSVPSCLNVLLVLVLALSIVGPAAAALPGAAPRPTAAMPQAGPGAHGGGDFLVSLDTSDQMYPTIAYNFTADEYLVVWSTLQGLVGKRYSAQGLPEGETFCIYSMYGFALPPAVAYNPTSQEYLVAWSQYTGPNQAIHGQLLSADGTLLDNPFTPENESDPEISFAIGDTGTGNQAQPIVAYNTAADEYLVVWEDERNGNRDLYGRLLDTDGFFLTENLALVTDAADQYDPDLSYNETADDYLLVWEDLREASPRIYRVLLDAAGGPAGPEEALSTVVSTAPALSYNAAQNQYLVVWYGAGPSDAHDIGGQIVNADGNPDGSPLTICAGPDSQEDPRVAYNAAQNQYLVVWADWRNRVGSSADIYGRRVGGDGTLVEQGDFLIAGNPDMGIEPAVAYSSGSFQFLVLWRSYAGSAQSPFQVHGQRLWWPGLPLGAAMDFGAPTGRQETPAVAYNSRYHEYMVVWADERDGNETIAVYAQRYDRDGAPLSGNVRLYMEEGIPYEQPVVAYNSYANNYLVAWDKGTTKWCVVSTQGTPGDCGIAYGQQPAVGSNSSAGNYLVLVADYPYGIAGVGIAATGAIVAPQFDISDVIQRDEHPAVAYNTTADQYLVVWENHTGADDWDIHARRLGGDFSVIDAEDITLTAGLGDQISATVAYNSLANEYLVAWTDYRDDATTGADIYAQRFGADGSRVGENILVTAAAGDQSSPALAYISALDRYRIVWEDGRNPANGFDLYGQWLAADGAVLSPVDRPVFRYPGHQTAPVLAYSPGYDNALTVWQDERNGSGADIYARFGALDTTPPVAGFNYAPSFGHTGGGFILSARPSTDDATPAGLLQVRWDLDGDGSWDTPLTLQKIITGTLPAPGVYTITLEVWDTAALTDTVTHHLYVQAPPTLEQAGYPTATLAVSPTYGPAGTVFSFDGSASAGGGTLVARWDWEDDGEFDTPFTTTLTATHAYTVSGDYTVRLDVRDLGSGLSDAGYHNITVVPGPVVSLEVRPSEVTLYTGEATYFTAIAADGYGNLMYHPTVTWSMSDTVAGTIGASGAFTAGNTPGEYPAAVQAESAGVTAHAGVVVAARIYRAYLPLVARGQASPSSAP